VYSEGKCQKPDFRKKSLQKPHSFTDTKWGFIFQGPYAPSRADGMGELGFQGHDNKLRGFVKAILEVGPTRGPGRSRPGTPFVMAGTGPREGKFGSLRPSVVGIPTTGSMGGIYGRYRGRHPGGYDGQLPREPEEVIPAPWRGGRQHGTRFDGHSTSTMGRLRP
jgi:hypothetical protein